MRIDADEYRPLRRALDVATEGVPSERASYHRRTALADDIRAKMEAGQAATATALRTLADQIEALPLTNAAEVLTWLAPHLDRLHREAGRV